MSEIVVLARDGSIHHALPLKNYFKERCVIESDWRPSVILKHNPELVISFDEHGCELGLCIGEMSRLGIATLQIMDGIIEWRRTWAYPTSPEKRPLNQPALSHKIACLGSADARVMESWGNVGRCEIVGSPRFDSLVEEKRPLRLEPVKSRPLRLLVMTAKTPGFTPEQVDTTYRGLEDLRDNLRARKDIQVVWRVTQDLHRRLGVENTVRSIVGAELHDILGRVDAVITTPSTAMLEAMLYGHPVALLDYHNCPHYVPSAWRITCRGQIETVLEDLMNAPLQRMLYQEFCLHDALSCRTPALPRMVKLIEEMIRIRSRHIPTGEKRPVYPHRILDAAEEHISWPSDSFSLERLYPAHGIFGRRDVLEMQAELEAALGTIEQLKRQTDILTRRLHRIPGYKLAKKLRKMLKA